jgi:hypothetical protein
MGRVLLFCLACGAAWYAGGPALALLIALVLTLWHVWSHNAHQHMLHETTPHDRARHRQDGSHHLYYADGDQLLHESEACLACLHARREDLQNRGIVIEEVIEGNHHPGE